MRREVIVNDFDYKRAWIELASPGFGNIPFELRELLKRVAVECADYGQDQTLRVIWPDDNGSLKGALSDWSSEDLSKAARSVYFFGHWNFHKDSEMEGYGVTGGSHWKFASYCDQILSERIDARLPLRTKGRWERSGRGVQIQVHEGFLRGCISSLSSWTWEEVGLATIDNAQKLSDLIGGASTAIWEERITKAVREIGMVDPWTAQWLNKDRFMNLPPKFKGTYGTSENGNFQVVDTIAVPHPYCITARHIAAGGILNSESIEAAERNGAACGIKGCRLSYKQHEVALLVSCKTEPNDELEKYLVGNKDECEKNGYAGFAFRNDF